MAAVAQSNLFDISTGILKKDACVFIVRTEWNATVVDEMEKGATRKLREFGVKNIQTLVVPGAFEIPFAVQQLWRQSPVKKRPDVFITLGCVLRGDTPHFEYVCRAVTDGVLQLNLTLPVPVIFGILTVDNAEQAIERIGGKHGHKGEEAALTALKMLQFTQKKRKKKSAK